MHTLSVDKNFDKHSLQIGHKISQKTKRNGHIKVRKTVATNFIDLYHVILPSHVISYICLPSVVPWTPSHCFFSMLLLYVNIWICFKGGNLECSKDSDDISVGSLCLKKWFRTATAIVLYLTDGTLQVSGTSVDDGMFQIFYLS